MKTIAVLPRSTLFVCLYILRRLPSANLSPPPPLSLYLSLSLSLSLSLIRRNQRKYKIENFTKISIPDICNFTKRHSPQPHWLMQCFILVFAANKMKSNCRQGALFWLMWASSGRCRHWSRWDTASFMPHAWMTNTCRHLIIGSAEALPILCVSDFCER